MWMDKWMHKRIEEWIVYEFYRVHVYPRAFKSLHKATQLLEVNTTFYHQKLF